jgi:PGF-pre-PGF domain-containing protein
MVYSVIILSLTIALILFFSVNLRDNDITGNVVVSKFVFPTESDFSTGTFNNTILFSDNSIRLGLNLTRVSSLSDSTWLDGAAKIFVIGDYAYVTGENNNSLNVINISDKLNPTRIGSISDDVLYSPYGLYVQGDYAYVAAYGNDSLSIINVTNKTNPVIITSFSDVPNFWLEEPETVFVVGDYAYIAADGGDALIIINITNKSNPITISVLNDSYFLLRASNIYVEGDYAYVTNAGSFEDFFTIINITNKSNPVIVNSTFLSEAAEVFVSNNYAYIPSYSNDSLNIFDITDKSAPVKVGFVSDPTWLENAWGVYILGDYAYVTANLNRSLNVINITNKSNPVRIGSLSEPDWFYGIAPIFISGNYVYLTARGNDSISIINITNQTFPSGTYESPIVNASYTARWFNISLSKTEPTGTDLTIAYRSCDDSLCAGESYSSYTSNSIINLSVNDNPYFQFKINLTTSNLSITSQLNSINISYGDMMSPQWSSNSTNGTAVGTLIKHNVRWTDEVTLSGYIFSFDNGTGTLSNDSFVAVSGTINWSNVTKIVNTTIGSTIRWRVYVNDSANNLNSTSIFNYTTTGDATSPTITINSPTSGQTFTTNNVTINISFSDNVALNYCSYNITNSVGGIVIATNTITCGTSSVEYQTISDGSNYVINTFANDTSGNSRTLVKTFSVDTAAPPGPDSPGGGGGGGVATTPSVIETQSVEEATPEAITTFSNFDPETGIKEISIDVNDEAQNIRIVVSKYDARPANVSVEKEGGVYKYLQIETGNLDSLEKATITFQIEKSWLTGNELEKESIALFKFDNSSEKWKELATRFKEEDDTFFYYDTELTSFSYFVIGEKIKSDFPWLWVLIGVIVLVLVIGIIMLIKRKQPNTP